MKHTHILLFAALILAGCARVISANEKQITLRAPPVAAADAQEKADRHCRQYGKVAVASGTMYWNHIVYRCE